MINGKVKYLCLVNLFESISLKENQAGMKTVLKKKCYHRMLMVNYRRIRNPIGALSHEVSIVNYFIDFTIFINLLLRNRCICTAVSKTNQVFSSHKLSCIEIPSDIIKTELIQKTEITITFAELNKIKWIFYILSWRTLRKLSLERNPTKALNTYPSTILLIWGGMMELCIDWTLRCHPWYLSHLKEKSKINK